MNMSTREYDNYRELIRNWNGSKEGLQRVYDEIYYRYDDGREMIRRLDSYQSHYTLDMH